MKKKVTNAEELAEAIAELELKAAVQKKQIQEIFADLSENMKPVNLIRNSAKAVFSDIHTEDVLNALIGVGTGILSRRLILGRTRGLIGKTLGRAVQWGMAALVSKNAEKIKEKAGEWIDMIFKKHKTDSDRTPATGPKQVPVS
ncbi:MAG TPA: hypothetical protein DIC22_09985 [Chitinophagaceae bacterium]|jgi:hypothetical protein|nr:hypothetical protein [Chitinophagaceae bacterium]